MGAAIGGVVGGIGGLLGQQKEGSTNSGNLFTGNNNQYQGHIDNIRNQAINASGTSYGDLQNQVSNGAGTSQLYGKGGSLGSAIGQLNNLNANPGLTSQDQTAYGQASGQIANQFGAQNNSIAQAMADRGMSNSGAAGAAFSNSFGNQAEQLGHLQTQIAQNREQMNLQQSQSLQSFISNLGAQQNQAIGQAGQQNQNAFSNSMGYLNAAQGQSNNQLDQSQSTGHASSLSSAFSGAAGGAMSGGLGGMFSGGGGGKQYNGQQLAPNSSPNSSDWASAMGAPGSK